MKHAAFSFFHVADTQTPSSSADLSPYRTVAALMVASRSSRSHESVARRNNLLFILLLSAAVRSCSGRAAIESDLGVAAATSPAGAAEAATAAYPKTSIKNGEASAATSSAASTLLDKERSITDVQKVDLSFSQIGFGGGLPDLAAAIGHSPSPVLFAGDSDQQQHQQQASDAPPLGDADVVSPPLALGLRECSLGDNGVSEIARSPWVTGSLGVRALSLRHNQVRIYRSIPQVCLISWKQ